LLQPISLYVKPRDWNIRWQYPSIRKQGGNWVRSNKEKAKTFALHFSNIFKPAWDNYKGAKQVLGCYYCCHPCYLLQNLLVVKKIRTKNQKSKFKKRARLRSYNQSNPIDAAKNSVRYFYQDRIVMDNGSSMPQIEETISKETLYSSSQRYNVSR